MPATSCASASRWQCQDFGLCDWLLRPVDRRQRAGNDRSRLLCTCLQPSVLARQHVLATVAKRCASRICPTPARPPGDGRRATLNGWIVGPVDGSHLPGHRGRRGAHCFVCLWHRLGRVGPGSPLVGHLGHLPHLLPIVVRLYRCSGSFITGSGDPGRLGGRTYTGSVHRSEPVGLGWPGRGPGGHCGAGGAPSVPVPIPPIRVVTQPTDQPGLVARPHRYCRGRCQPAGVSCRRIAVLCVRHLWPYWSRHCRPAAATRSRGTRKPPANGDSDCWRDKFNRGSRSVRILVYPHDLSMGGSQINAIEIGAKVRDLGHEVVIFGQPARWLTRSPISIWSLSLRPHHVDVRRRP